MAQVTWTGISKMEEPKVKQVVSTGQPNMELTYLEIIDSSNVEIDESASLLTKLPKLGLTLLSCLECILSAS